MSQVQSTELSKITSTIFLRVNTGIVIEFYRNCYVVAVFFLFGEKEKWQNLLKTLYRTFRGRLWAYLLKPKNPSLEPIRRPRNRLSALNFAGDWFQLKVAYDSSVIRSPGTPIHGHTLVRQTG